MLNIFRLPIEKKYQIKSHLYSAAWCLLLLQVLILDSRLPKLPFSLTLPCFLLLCISAVYPFQYTLREICMLSVFGVIALLVSLVSKYNILIWVFAFIACSKGIPLKPVLFKTLLIYSFIFITAVILSQLGIIPDTIRYNGVSPYAKHSLGLGDPNTTHAVFLIIVCLIFALYYEKLTYKHLLLLLLANTALLLFTICKTSAAIVYFLLIAAAFEKFLKNKISRRLYNSILILLIAFMAFVVLFMTFAPMYFDWNSPFYQVINNLFTGRFSLAKKFFDRYELLPFGNFISELSAVPRTEYLDIGYAVLLLQYGYLFTILFIGGYFLLYFRFYHKKDFSGILIVTAVLLFMTSENIMTIMFYNFSYFWFRDFIFKTENTTTQ